jgi:RNA polymerase sigma-70 factor (ECF subfamily)
MADRRAYERADERELVEWAQGGDQRAFAELVERNRTMTYTVCYRITGNAADAQDAVQLALTAAWRNIHRFQHRSRFSTWLYQVARNAALGEIRKRRAQPVGDDVLGIVDGTRHFDETLADVDAVQRALQRIPPDFRAALVLREYGGLSYQEIADAEGIKVETVKTRIARARRAMALLLEADDAA